ncbi:MAG: leucine-rich repeat domain-containing protein [Oscillospiraceae bacterium]|nr:leucine-rich repeat domain-containing protein [Oscillospiraceae bacterium]
MIHLDCSGNQLTSLDVSKNLALTTLYCSDNQLTSLDVSQNAALYDLSCSGNQLTSLDVSGCTTLEYLNCAGNAYAIDLIGGKFDLTTLPKGFDLTKADGWLNATVDGSLLTVSNPLTHIIYVYTLGNGSTESFTLVPKSCTLEESMVSKIEDQTFTGSDITPEIEVNYGQIMLVNGKDYTVVYENNLNPGTASVTITGKGFFSGEVTVTFEIMQKNIADAEINPIAALTYTGEEQTPHITITYQNTLLTEGIILDVYTIDPVTGIGTEADGTEVNLPQTGISVVYNYIMLAAAAMVLFGIYAMAKSRNRDEE